MKLAGRISLALAAAILPLAAAAPAAAEIALTLPGAARPTAAEREPQGRLALPAGPFADGTMPTEEARGAVTHRAWRLPGQRLTTGQIIAPLAAQLAEAGFTPVFECRDRRCGGFDFRFNAPLLPEPAMHVDLGDFRYVLARRAGEGAELVALLVSRSANAGHVQLSHVGPAGAAPALVASTKSEDLGQVAAAPLAVPSGAAGLAADAESLARALSAGGRAVLRGVDFASGSTALARGEAAVLTELADWLAANPGRRAVLVGHTDDEGALDGNIALSQMRAEAVRQRLIAAHGIAPDRLTARGIGYLSPIAPNDSPEGRAANRRVEVVVE